MLIGCGYTSGPQLAAWANIHGVTITAVVNRTRAKAQRRADEFDIPAVYPDLPTMLEETAPDFVDIATPPASHVELVEVAAHYGVDILCQKPAAETLGELRHMVAVCKDADVALIINENGRFQPWHRRIYELIHSDQRLGDLRNVRLESRAQLTMPVSNFAGQEFFVTMPRLILFELGVHHLDTLRYLLGEASTISARTKRVSPHVVGEDESVSVSDHDGVTATVDMSWARAPSLGTSIDQVTWASMRIEGSAGVLMLGYDGALTIDGVPDRGQAWEASNGVQLGYEAMQQHFVDCLVTGIEAETSGSETLKTMELVFGAYHSANTGQEYRVGSDVGELL